MDDDERVKCYLEMWKQTIEVQKHFNDIELRIRNLALTALTFALGGATLAAKEDRAVDLGWFRLQLGAVVLLAGLILWLAFYFMDQVWYHRLLIGAVKHGEQLETALRQYIPEAGLTREISLSSAYTFRAGPARWGGRQVVIRSSRKVQIFYYSIAIVLLALAAMVQVGTSA